MTLFFSLFFFLRRGPLEGPGGPRGPARGARERGGRPRSRADRRNAPRGPARASVRNNVRLGRPTRIK